MPATPSPAVGAAVLSNLQAYSAHQQMAEWVPPPAPTSQFHHTALDSRHGSRPYGGLDDRQRPPHTQPSSNPSYYAGGPPVHAQQRQGQQRYLPQHHTAPLPHSQPRSPARSAHGELAARDGRGVPGLAAGYHAGFATGPSAHLDPLLPRQQHRHPGAPNHSAQPHDAAVLHGHPGQRHHVPVGGINPLATAAVRSQEFSKTNVYISGLRSDTTDEDLLHWCRPYGNIVSVKAIIDRESQHCKGYGFVMFEREGYAAAAVQGLMRNGVQAAFAKVTKSQPEFPARPETDPTNLYFTNLPRAMDEPRLEALLLQALASRGRVVSCRVLRDEHGASRGVALARMDTHNACEIVIKVLNGRTLQDTSDKIRVKFANGPTPRKGRSAAGSVSPPMHLPAAADVATSTAFFGGVAETVAGPRANSTPHISLSSVLDSLGPGHSGYAPKGQRPPSAPPAGLPVASSSRPVGSHGGSVPSSPPHAASRHRLATPAAPQHSRSLSLPPSPTPASPIGGSRLSIWSTNPRSSRDSAEDGGLSRSTSTLGGHFGDGGELGVEQSALGGYGSSRYSSLSSLSEPTDGFDLSSLGITLPPPQQQRQQQYQHQQQHQQQQQQQHPFQTDQLPRHLPFFATSADEMSQ